MLIQKKCRIGNEVSVQGKQGVVMEVADKVKVKFHDGTFGFVEEDMVEVTVDDGSRQDSRLKHFSVSHPDIPTADDPYDFIHNEAEQSAANTREMVSHTQPKIPSCPFCGGEARPIGMEFENKVGKAHQCMKCSERFIAEEPIKVTGINKEIFNTEDYSTQRVM
jgi:hypothetical protein